jgi:hypothetical protein
MINTDHITRVVEEKWCINPGNYMCAHVLYVLKKNAVGKVIKAHNFQGLAQWDS